jgi:hypothetical protein
MNMSMNIREPLPNPVDLDQFKESLKIVFTGKDSKGGSYNNLGKLNQAAWVGENSELLIHEVETLRTRLADAENELRDMDRLKNLCVNVHNLAAAYRDTELARTICGMFEQPEVKKLIDPERKNETISIQCDG